MWQVFIAESRGLLWREVVPDSLDEDIKGHVKNVKSLHKSTRWYESCEMSYMHARWSVFHLASALIDLAL